jgi:hypothetical protein
MKIVKGDTTFSGLIDIDGKLACEQCKEINPKVKSTMHMDFVDRYVNSYECCNCGNEISKSTIRTGEDADYWSE